MSGTDCEWRARLQGHDAGRLPAADGIHFHYLEIDATQNCVMEIRISVISSPPSACRLRISTWLRRYEEIVSRSQVDVVTCGSRGRSRASDKTRGPRRIQSKSRKRKPRRIVGITSIRKFMAKGWTGGS